MGLACLAMAKYVGFGGTPDRAAAGSLMSEMKDERDIGNLLVSHRLLAHVLATVPLPLSPPVEAPEPLTAEERVVALAVAQAGVVFSDPTLYGEAEDLEAMLPKPILFIALARGGRINRVRQMLDEEAAQGGPAAGEPPLVHASILGRYSALEGALARQEQSRVGGGGGFAQFRDVARLLLASSPVPHLPHKCDLGHLGLTALPPSARLPGPNGSLLLTGNKIREVRRHPVSTLYGHAAAHALLPAASKRASRSA